MKRIFIGFMFIILLVSCGEKIIDVEKEELVLEKKGSEDIKEPIVYEITEVDIFKDGLEGFNSMDNSYVGLRLGDPQEKAIENIGMPDDLIAQGDKLQNYIYHKTLGKDEIVLVFVFIENELKIVNFMNESNHMLHGNTIINRTKGQIYSKFGIPEIQKDADIHYRHFVYDSYGFEATLRAGKHVAWRFFEPGKWDELNGMEEAKEVKVELI